MTPISAAGLKLLEYDMLRILDDAANTEARLNRKRAESGLEPLPRMFFLADEVGAIVDEYEARLKPKPPEGAWAKEKRLRAEEQEGRRRDPEAGLQIVAMALDDPRLRGCLRSFLRDTLIAFPAPAIASRSATAWIDTWASAIPPKPKPVARLLQLPPGRRNERDTP